MNQTIDERIKHVTAIVLGNTHLEPFISINYDTFEYVKGTGDVQFKGEIIPATGATTSELIAHFPFYFLRGGTDDEIVKWREQMLHEEFETNSHLSIEEVLQIGRDLQNADKWHGAQYETVKLLCDTIEQLQEELRKPANAGNMNNRRKSLEARNEAETLKIQHR